MREAFEVLIMFCFLNLGAYGKDIFSLCENPLTCRDLCVFLYMFFSKMLTKSTWLQTF